MASTEDDVVVRLRLKDVRQFIEDVKAGKLAIDDLERKVKKAGQTAARESSSSGGFGKLASHFGFLKYAAFGAVTSLAAATGGVVGYAVKSASSLEQVTVAFTTLLHSSSAAKTMVAGLQTFAQQTPFELSGVEQTTQRLLAFGFTAKSIIPTLTAIGNAASGLNLGQTGMDEIALVLGQMKSLGRIQGGDLLQLAQHGINGYGLLEKGLGLTPAAFQKAMQAGKISAAQGVPILLRGMEQQYKGLMAKESGTLGGIWSNLHDAIQQGLINLVNPFMPAMKKWLGEVTNYLGGPDGKSGLFARAAKFMAVLPGNITAGRSGFAAYNVGAILGNHKFDPAIEKGVRVVHNLGVIVKDVLVPALKDFSVVLAPVVLVLEHLDQITGFVADHSTAFRVVVDVLAGSFLAYKGAVLAMNVGIAAYNLVTGIAAVKTVAFTDATEAQRLAIIGLAIATKAWAVIQGGIAFLQLAAGVRSLSEAFVLLDIAMDANPIGLVIVAIAAAGAAFYLAYTKVKPFREYINGLWADMRGFAEWVQSTWNVVMGNAPAGTSITAPHAGGAALGSLLGLLNPAGLIGGAIGGAIGDRIKTHQASGGTTVRPGLSWVGEQGPELLSMPRGAQVIPLPRVGEAVSRGPIHVHVMVDKREIAQAVYDDMGDRVARR